MEGERRGEGRLLIRKGREGELKAGGLLLRGTKGRERRRGEVNPPKVKSS